VVDEHLAHHPSGDGKEVLPALEPREALVHEAQVGLVHERRGGEGVPGTFGTQDCRSASTKVVVDQREQPVGGVLVSFAPRAKELGDLSPRRVVIGVARLLEGRLESIRRK
jgi:hypothetical protein